jgi:hypothetical protein
MQDTRFVRGNLALLADSHYVLSDVIRRKMRPVDHCGEERAAAKRILR